MAGMIHEVEITGALSPVQVPMDAATAAFIVRRNDRPVAFFMHAVSPGSTLKPERIHRWIQERAAPEILADSLREELDGPRASLTPVSLTIAICTKDHEALVRRCLGALRDMILATSVPEDRIQILVVDNAPSDERTKKLAETLEGVTYTREPRPGLDFARNRALQEASGEWIAFMDDDVVADKCWLEGFRRALQDHQDAGGITGPVLPLELATRAQVLFEERGGFRRGFHRIRHTQQAPRSPIAPCNAGVFGAGANMAFRRDLLLRIGGFDEALDTGRPLPGGGDLDIFYRVVRAGCPMAYEPLMTVRHEHRREYRQLRHQMWTWGLGMMAFTAKSWQSDAPMRGKFLLLICGWFFFMTAKVLRCLLGLNSHQWTAGLAFYELSGGVAGLFGEYSRSQRRIRAIKEGACP